MKFYAFFVAALMLAFHVPAGPVNSAAPMKIGTGDVTNYYGQEMVVTGKVAEVSIHRSVVLLNMDQPYPDSPFTLVIFSKATNQFSNLKSLRGAAVEATGVITNY